MFFTLTRTHPIYLHPALFGPSLKSYIHSSLLSEVEGTCDGHYYTIAVLDITHVSGGRVRSGVGKAEFRVEYEALVWKPFIGEVVCFEPFPPSIFSFPPLKRTTEEKARREANVWRERGIRIWGRGRYSSLQQSVK